MLSCDRLSTAWSMLRWLVERIRTKAGKAWSLCEVVPGDR
jgi:hypothetical protein